MLFEISKYVLLMNKKYTHMKELSLTKMEATKGGSHMQQVKGGCGWWDHAGLGFATVALFAAPFTGGISMGVLALGSFVVAAYSHGKAGCM